MDTKLIQQLARQAGVELPEQRADSLGPSAQGLAAAAQLLASIDYRHTEPAIIFPPPDIRKR